MKYKKAQLTIFIVIGITIFVLIIVFFTFSNSQNLFAKYSEKTSAEIDSIKGCIDEVIVHGAYFVFLQGGYAIPPDDSLSYLTFKIPTYWEKNQSFVPSVNSVETELEKFFEVNIPFCFDSDVNLNGKIKITLRDDFLFFEIISPLYFNSNNEKIQADDFSIEKEVYFDKFHGIIKEVVKSNEEFPSYLSLSKLNNEVKDASMTYEILEFDESVKMLSLIGPELDSRGPLVYNFVMKF